MIVCRGAGGLQHKDFLAAHVFLDFNADFTVRKAVDSGFADWKIQNSGNSAGKLRVGIACEYHQAIIFQSIFHWRKREDSIAIRRARSDTGKITEKCLI